MVKSYSLCEILSDSLVDGLDEIQGAEVAALWDVIGTVNANGQILGHLPTLNAFNR